MRHMLLSALVIVVLSSQARAQEGEVEAIMPPVPNQQRFESSRTNSAREAIQRRAALKAEQRRARLEAAKWMGYHPSRPPVSQMQFMGADGSRRVGTVYYHFPGMLLPHYVLMAR